MNNRGMDVSVSYEGPKDRLSRIVDQMFSVANTHDETISTDRWIIMGWGGDGDALVGTAGYDDMRDAAADLLTHLMAMFKANGIDLSLIPMQTRGQG